MEEKSFDLTLILVVALVLMIMVNTYSNLFGSFFQMQSLLDTSKDFLL